MRERLYGMRKAKWIELFVMAQVADLVLTVVCIVCLGCWEANPIMARLGDMAMVKMGLIAVMVYVLWAVRLPMWAYRLFFWMSMFPVVWNVIVIGSVILY